MIKQSCRTKVYEKVGKSYGMRLSQGSSEGDTPGMMWLRSFAGIKKEFLGFICRQTYKCIA